MGNSTTFMVKLRSLLGRPCPAKFMVSLYILVSDLGKYYVGITSLLVANRIKRHNNGDVYSTKLHRPWKLIYTEKFTDFADARAREKKIKSWHGGNAFKKLIAGAAGSSNGRIVDSESTHLGPNPSPAALVIRKFGGVK